MRKHATLNVACVFALLQSAENLCLSVRERGGAGRREKRRRGKERESQREGRRERERERAGGRERESMR